MDEFVQKFVDIGVTPDLTDHMRLDFEIDRNLKRMDCYLTLAKPEDANDITKIYIDCYNGTYPYKEMTDSEAVRQMIINKDYYWVLFKSPEEKTIGCFTYVLDMEQKKGYMRGLMIKRKFQTATNVKKLMIGSMIGMWSTFKKEINRWYAECRTAHAKSQYLANICGIKPLAIFPNKDLFLNQVESDIFHIIFSANVLYKLRRMSPKLIPKIKSIYSFVSKIYTLEEPEFIEPIVNYDHDIESAIYYEDRIKVFEDVDRFGYRDVTIKIVGSGSYIKFLYTPTIQNIENTEFFVRNDTELYVLLKEMKRYALRKKVRYLECFVSAYKPNHQRIFIDLGFKVRGYCPSWKRIENGSGEQFEDCIIFNINDGQLNPDIKLIPEVEKLIRFIDI